MGRSGQVWPFAVFLLDSKSPSGGFFVGGARGQVLLFAPHSFLHKHQSSLWAAISRGVAERPIPAAEARKLHAASRKEIDDTRLLKQQLMTELSNCHPYIACIFRPSTSGQANHYEQADDQGTNHRAATSQGSTWAEGRRSALV